MIAGESKFALTSKMRAENEQGNASSCTAKHRLIDIIDDLHSLNDQQGLKCENMLLSLILSLSEANVTRATSANEYSFTLFL